MIRRIAIALAVVWSISVASAEAGYVYYTSLDSGGSGGNALFARYDTSTNSWTTLNNYDTQTQMAVDTAGNLYAYRNTANAIEKYNPGTDTWTFVMNGPGVNPFFGNLEITTSGRFIFTYGASNQLYYSDGGGIWNSTTLPFLANAAGDYDPTTNQYVIGEWVQSTAHLVDTTTFAVTSYLPGPGSVGEHRRMGTILNGQYYGGSTGSLDIFTWNLANNSLAPSTLAVPSGEFWFSSTVDRANNTIYVANLLDGSFYSLIGGVFTPLANAPPVSNHSSLAFVATAVPEPSSLALLGLGAFGAFIAARRRRTGKR